VAAVSNDRCGCALKTRLRELFAEVDTRFCDISCPAYANELCGGLPDYWGVFRDYDRLSLSGQGAYDPWRYIFYQVVTVEEPDGREIDTVPERYYLHAMSTSTGFALFEFQMRINPPGMLYGLQYDIDSTRLIALFIDAVTARVEVRDWTYKLATIIVNTSDYVNPNIITLPRVRMQMTTTTMFRPAAAYQQSDVFQSLPYPLEYLSFTGSSAIISQDGTDSFVFSQVEGAASKKDMKDRMFIISVPDGEVLKDEGLDFKVLQFLTNEKFGDISAVGPRESIGKSYPVQQYIHMAQVRYSEEDDTKKVDWMFSAMAPHLLTDDGLIDDYWFYPSVSCSEHLFKKSMLTYKALPAANSGESWANIPITILQVDLEDKKLFKQWGTNGTMPPEVPWAPIYNREPRIPLSLAAPALLEARFDMEAGSIIVQFDQPTLKGAKPVDTDGDIVPDMIDYKPQMTMPVTCDRIFNDATVVKLGEGASCEWPASETVQIVLAKDFSSRWGTPSSSGRTRSTRSPVKAPTPWPAAEASPCRCPCSRSRSRSTA
jgi:hypothetical protein